MKKINFMLAILTRISRDNDDKVSLETQLESGIKQANKLGLKYKQYEERVVSSIAPLSERPTLMQLVKDIEEGKVTAVFVYNQDRLERSVQTRAILINIFKKYNVSTYYNTGLVDASSENKLLGDILSAIGEYQIEMTSTKIKLAINYNAGKGKVHALPPYAYYKDENKQYAINIEQAEVIKDIYAMSLSGVGTNKIAEILNERGIPTKYNLIGKGTLSTINKKHKLKPKVTKNKSDIKWTGNSVRGILYNKFYCGIRVFNGVVYEVPKLFDYEYWKKVNDNLKKNRNNSGKVVTHKYLLKGLLTCGRCGRNYYGRSRVSLKDNTYICSSKRYKEHNCGNRGINITALEKLIWTKFIGQETLKNLIIEHFKNNDNDSISKEIVNEIEDINQQISQLNKDKNNIITSISKGIITDDDARSIMNTIRIKLSTLGEQKQVLNEKLSGIKNSIYTLNNILSELEIKSSEEVSFLDKKEIINKYIDNIIIHFDETGGHAGDGIYYLEIKFNIPMMKDYLYSLEKNCKVAYCLFNDKKNIDLQYIILDDKLKNKLKNEKKLQIIFNVNLIEDFESYKNLYVLK